MKDFKDTINNRIIKIMVCEKQLQIPAANGPVIKMNVAVKTK